MHVSKPRVKSSVLTVNHTWVVFFLPPAFRLNHQVILYSSFIVSLLALLLHRPSTMIVAFGQRFYLQRTRLGAMFSLSLRKQTTMMSLSPPLFKCNKRKHFYSTVFATSEDDDVQLERMPSASVAGGSTVTGNSSRGLLTEEQSVLARGIFCNTELSMAHITAVRIVILCDNNNLRPLCMC